ncbi:hypothetical protein BGZ73_003723 [Actinomortierella ambigua]|nr:hypothetical protein BGZ73_003723 [Actinomortierella ambigua]
MFAHGPSPHRGGDYDLSASHRGMPGPSTRRIQNSLFYSVPTIENELDLNVGLDHDDHDDLDSNDHFGLGHDEDMGGGLGESVPLQASNYREIHHQHSIHHGAPRRHHHAHDPHPQLPYNHRSYDHDDDDTGSDISDRSPPMSLFLDRELRPEAPLTPAAIYLDVPPPVSNKASSSKGSKLSEQLLAPKQIPTGPIGWTSISYKRQFKDPVFAILYILAMVAYFVLGIVLLFTTSSASIGDHIYTVYKVIKSSAGMLTLVILVSAGLGALWLLMLRTFARPVVWVTVLLVPFFSLSLFIWSLVSAFNGPKGEGGKQDAQDTGLAVLSMLPLLLGGLFLAVIYFKKEHIARTTDIIELACDILKDNPDMIVVSFGLMVIHVVFAAIWLVFFSRVFLVGHVDTSTTAGGGAWVLEGNSYPMAIFMIFMFLWTTAVLGNIQRVTLAGVVSKWYFHRHEPFTYQSSKIMQPILVNATTSSLGTVCLGALFIAIVQAMVLTLRYSQRKLKEHNIPVFIFLATCCRFIEGLVENFNNYTLIYVGITGESLFSAARSASKIFRRNLLWGLMSDFLTKLILNINSMMLSVMMGFAAYIFATHTLHSPYGYVIGILASIIPYYVTRFFTHIMSITVDATFLCYAIDLDTNTCHSNKAHSAFGGAR